MMKSGGPEVSSFCSACNTRHCTPVKYPIVNYEYVMGQIVITTKGIYPWSFVKHIP